MNNVVSPLSSLFQHFSESIWFKVEYIEGMEFSYQIDLSLSTFQQLFEVLGHSRYGH